MRSPKPGISRCKDITPGANHTAAALGNPGIEVTATTALILFIEEVSSELLQPYLEDGEGSVGVRVEVDHLAPAFVGEPVTITATVDEIRKHRVMFSAEARQDHILVMKGFHHRAVVTTEQFSDSVTRSSAKQFVEPRRTRAAVPYR